MWISDMCVCINQIERRYIHRSTLNISYYVRNYPLIEVDTDYAFIPLAKQHTLFTSNGVCTVFCVHKRLYIQCVYGI